MAVTESEPFEERLKFARLFVKLCIENPTRLMYDGRACAESLEYEMGVIDAVFFGHKSATFIAPSYANERYEKGFEEAKTAINHSNARLYI